MDTFWTRVSNISGRLMGEGEGEGNWNRLGWDSFMFGSLE